MAPDSRPVLLSERERLYECSESGEFGAPPVEKTELFYEIQRRQGGRDSLDAVASARVFRADGFAQVERGEPRDSWARVRAWRSWRAGSAASRLEPGERSGGLSARERALAGVEL
jgi:hypothetical protein